MSAFCVRRYCGPALRVIFTVSAAVAEPVMSCNQTDIDFRGDIDYA